jgi:hypothetical protein
MAIVVCPHGSKESCDICSKKDNDKKNNDKKKGKGK